MARLLRTAPLALSLTTLPLAASAAEQASTTLRGNSIIANSTQTLVMKGVNGDWAGQTHSWGFIWTIEIYVSLQGHIFSEVNINGGRSSHTSQDVSGSADNWWHFEGGALVGDVAVIHGARRIIINFTDNYGICSLSYLYGREAGGAPIIMRGQTGDQELVSQFIADSSCKMQKGNVFGDSF